MAPPPQVAVAEAASLASSELDGFTAKMLPPISQLAQSGVRFAPVCTLLVHCPPAPGLLLGWQAEVRESATGFGVQASKTILKSTKIKCRRASYQHKYG